MSAGGRPPNRREAEVRRLLDTPHPAVPPDLAERAALRGRGLLRRRRVLRYALGAALLAAALAAAVLLA
ncbi:hypothetical protein RVR_6490 [Actinacidiphila reveromycinica]|uniref:Uncharacterized protein n=1 Tax=Actinacidiphila reveromycinica TaxID=659352 RepID=A0A7U3VQF7_9ACTN|nr:hypothetical protein [Streptomyces sp. SN-593]BBA99740.1 hypothetical protein RVR_6490 [Streptomyces sp. SN-593]